MPTAILPQFLPIGPITINLHFAVVILIIIIVIGITKLLVPEYDLALFLTAMAAGFTATVLYDMVFGPRFDVRTLVSTKSPSELQSVTKSTSGLQNNTQIGTEKTSRPDVIPGA